jgi:exonuclease SbcC
MKILRISLRNIASLAGEHTVDFTVAPLVNTGLFSISGPTGSGKSTLLDALCLALYDETPRMCAVAGTNAVDDAGKSVQQGDVRNLLRRGCGEGYAEVAFVGVDGQTYTAHWSVRRAQGKADRALQPTQHALFRGDARNETERHHAADGTRTDVKNAIVAKVGLTFDQFRRAVLLAQGDFATFLKAKDTERAEILQALTGTERFEKISIAVFDRNKREEAAAREIQQQLGATLPWSPGERAAAEEALRVAVARKKEVDATVAARQRQLEWFETEQQHLKQVGEASEQVRQLEAQVADNQPRARQIQWIRIAALEAGPKRAAEKRAQEALDSARLQETELQKHQQVLLAGEEAGRIGLSTTRGEMERVLKQQQDLASELIAARAFDAELVPLTAALMQAEKESTLARQVEEKARMEFGALLKVVENLGSQKAAQSRSLAQWTHWEPFARDIEMWLERFRVEDSVRAKREGMQVRLKQAVEKFSKAAEQLQTAEAAAAILRKDCETREASLREAAEGVSSFNAEQIHAQRKRAAELRMAWQELRVHLVNQARLLAEQQTCDRQLAPLGEEIHAGEARIEQLNAREIPAARVALQQSRDTLRLAEAASSAHAVILRQALVPGKGCPVCGSCDHPGALPESSENAGELKTLKKDESTKEKELGKLNAELAQAEARLEEKKKQLAGLQKQREKAGADILLLQRFVPQDAEVVEVLHLPESQREQELETRESRAAQDLAALESREAGRIEAEKKWNKLRTESEKVAGRLKDAESAEADARSRKSVADAERRQAEEQLFQIDADHRNVWNALAPIGAASEGAVPGESVGAWDESRRGRGEDLGMLRARFEREARDWLRTRREVDELTQSEKVKQEQLPGRESALEAAAHALKERLEQQDSARKVFEERQAARRGLLGGRAVGEVEAALAADIQRAKAAEAASATAYEEAKHQSKYGGALLDKQQQEVGALSTRLQGAKEVLEEWLGAFAQREGCAVSRDTLDAWLAHDVQWIEREQRELSEAESRLAAARVVEKKWRDHLEEHARSKTSDDDLEKVRNELLGLETQTQTAIAEVDRCRLAVLGDDEKIQNKGALLKTLEAQEERWRPWQKLNALIGSADGTRFRNIAQQWTLEILLQHANAQLEMLSGRYRLERLRDSLNLLVTDRDMDGQQRSVHSLSGGESFLVSLGLALGLASLTSSRLLIESLFIDEGFGSLDAETLRVALNALSHLQSQGRKVGVISHVSEMVDVIPVQIRVVRVSGGASRIAV